MQIDRHLGEPLGRLYVAQGISPPTPRNASTSSSTTCVDRLPPSACKPANGCPPKPAPPPSPSSTPFMRKIGYPDKFRDYSDYEVKDDSYVQNTLRGAAFDFRYWLRQARRPRRSLLWGMTPPTVNAYYDATLNEIVFPAGILQPPYFDPTCDDALNYGAIGAVIGHEMTHGFDDQGSKYDATGNLHDWWTAEDRARYTARTDKIVQEFNACIGVDDVHVNGKLTLGENIADLGGLTIAYDAYHESLAGKPAPTLDGFTGDQRFFLAYAISRARRLPPRLPPPKAPPHQPPLPTNSAPTSPLSNFTPVLRSLQRHTGKQDVPHAGELAPPRCGDAPAALRGPWSVARGP